MAEDRAFVAAFPHAACLGLIPLAGLVALIKRMGGQVGGGETRLLRMRGRQRVAVGVVGGTVLCQVLGLAITRVMRMGEPEVDQEGPLVGGKDSLKTAKPLKTVGSFWPYSTTLYDYIRRAMPFDNPGLLDANQTYAVTALILHWNGIIGEKDVIDATTLPKVKMPNRDGFVKDERPDTGPKAKKKK